MSNEKQYYGLIVRFKEYVVRHGDPHGDERNKLLDLFSKLTPPSVEQPSEGHDAEWPIIQAEKELQRRLKDKPKPEPQAPIGSSNFAGGWRACYAWFGDRMEQLGHGNKWFNRKGEAPSVDGELLEALKEAEQLLSKHYASHPVLTKIDNLLARRKES